MKIRKATTADTAVIIRFQENLALETENINLEHETVKHGVRRVLEDSSKGFYFVAEEQGQVVGSLLITFEWSDWRNGTILWVQSVYVIKEQRRKGIYKALYSHLQDRISTDPEIKGIRLYADKSNYTAQNVYASLGMTAEHYQLYEWLK